jgi:hypothetical protein
MAIVRVAGGLNRVPGYGAAPYAGQTAENDAVPVEDVRAAHWLAASWRSISRRLRRRPDFRLAAGTAVP